ncbi:hypothetical protein BU15DRAFT_51817, partial [Melanogaster broomeanus]
FVHMQRYNPDFSGRYPSLAEHPGAFNASLKEHHARVDDHGSPSGSEDDGGYPPYSDPQKMEIELDDDTDTALTSQSLNADGTPKRPMNAFMIFARRRRPQVSAENQSMRTGDVSKILSREWTGMSLSDKQFYLDQAKLLKDNFNQKYPDYVYKRRPNNSRKRRKADQSSGLPADYPSTSDAPDDYPGGTESSDTSPIEVAEMDDSHYGTQDVRYASLPAEASGSTYAAAHSRASSYHPPEGSAYHLDDTHIPYISSRHSRATPESGMSSASRGSDHATSYYHHHPYYPAQQQHHAQSSYFSESSAGEEGWSNARDDQTRMQVQSWSQGIQDHSDLGVDDRGYAASSHGWTNPSPSQAMPSSSASGSASPGYDFPTLNSPFHPSQNNPQERYSSPAPHISHYSSVPQMHGRSYSSLQQAYPPGSTTTIASYQQQPTNISLPSAHPVPPYPHVQSTSPPSPTGPQGRSFAAPLLVEGSIGPLEIGPCFVSYRL